MTSEEELWLLEQRLVQCDQQCRALLSENDLLRGLLREAIHHLLGDLPASELPSFIDKLERFL
jgi:hypothetical protein